MKARFRDEQIMAMINVQGLNVKQMIWGIFRSDEPPEDRRCMAAAALGYLTPMEFAQKMSMDKLAALRHRFNPKDSAQAGGYLGRRSLPGTPSLFT